MQEHSSPKYVFRINDIPKIIPSIKLPRVHYVIKAGYVQLYYPSLGRGASNIYSLNDVYMFAVFNQLLEYGIDLKNAEVLSKKAAIFIANFGVAKPDDVLVLSGNDMAFMKQRDLKISFDVKNYRPQVVIAVGLIKQDVYKRIAELMLRRDVKHKIKAKQTAKAKRLTERTSLR